MVLRKDETAAGQTYKYAKATKVHTSTDGKVRAADIEYKLPGESVFRTTTRPIHKLVLIVPIEEQTSAAGLAKEEEVRADGPAPPAEAEPGPAQPEVPPLAIEPEPAGQKGAEMAEEKENPGGTVTHPAQDEEGAKRPAAKYKKVISRKKAGKQTRTIVMTVPKGEAEIVDIGAKPKKRGRPRKVPSVDPPDPHKGSVSDPDKGVCADPVDRGAILGRGESDPHSESRERQLAPDRGRGKT